MRLSTWKKNLNEGRYFMEDNTDHPDCPKCGSTMNFYGHDDNGDFPYGEGYWECPSCGFSITEADLQPGFDKVWDKYNRNI